MTRSDFVAELLGIWEKALKDKNIRENPVAEQEIKTAISVLERTYSGEELLRP